MSDVSDATVDAVFFNPFDGEFFVDPYPQYRMMRERDPIHNSPLGLVMLFAFEDIRQLQHETRTSMDLERAAPSAARPARTDADDQPASLALITRDPPDHTRIRKLMSRSFTPKRMDRLSAWIQAEVDTVLAEVADRHRGAGEPADIVAEFAFPLPFRVISKLLGMPEGDDSQIRSWTRDVTLAADPMVTPELQERAGLATKGLRDFVNSEVLPWKRANPSEDMLTGLLAAQDNGDLSPDELLDQVTLLYMAGHETTTGLIGNGIYNLLRHRAQLDRLRDDPTLVPNAVEELNRFEGPIQFSWRVTLDDITVSDTVIPAGQMVFMCLGSGNHDPDHFGPDAEALDITRPNANELLSFGGGIHFCLGAALARREATLALAGLIRRFPAMEVAEEPEWSRRITFRGFDNLLVNLG